MNSCPKKSLTLIELLIAITLLSVIILAISNIDLFTRFHTVSADRRVKLQNEVSYVLEHMSKEISRAIGNVVIDGINNIVDFTPIAGDTAIRVYRDSNATGGPGDGKRDAINDRWVAYRFTGATGSPATQFQIWYYPNYVNPASTYEVIARHILSPNPLPSVTDNYVNVTLTACWDPDGAPYACGTPDNPSVSMSNRIKMPSVSTH